MLIGWRVVLAATCLRIRSALVVWMMVRFLSASSSLSYKQRHLPVKLPTKSSAPKLNNSTKFRKKIAKLIHPGNEMKITKPQ
jgi:hypothetical protein